MTFKQFLKLVRYVRRKDTEVLGCPRVGPATFHLNKDGQIDSVEEECCPIQEVAWRTLNDSEIGLGYFVQGRALGLSAKLVHRITNAADGKTNGRYRRELLKACGIKA